ncbi:MAG: rod-binding protein [Pseudomonadota bacterium]|nr:rod-binding protein [Pseudomonadota bacterium]
MSGAIYNDFSQFTTLRAEATKSPNAALEGVAAQFESIFLQQMLKSMRDATVKSGLFESSQMETYQSMADQQLAVQLSEQGGIGLARMMVEQMQTRGLVPELDDDTNGETTVAKPEAQHDVAQVFGPVVANANDQRSDD